MSYQNFIWRRWCLAVERDVGLGLLNNPLLPTPPKVTNHPFSLLVLAPKVLLDPGNQGVDCPRHIPPSRQLWPLTVKQSMVLQSKGIFQEKYFPRKRLKIPLSFIYWLPAPKLLLISLFYCCLLPILCSEEFLLLWIALFLRGLRKGWRQPLCIQHRDINYCSPQNNDIVDFSDLFNSVFEVRLNFTQYHLQGCKTGQLFPHYHELLWLLFSSFIYILLECYPLFLQIWNSCLSQFLQYSFYTWIFWV